MTNQYEVTIRTVNPFYGDTATTTRGSDGLHNALAQSLRDHASHVYPHMDVLLAASVCGYWCRIDGEELDDVEKSAFEAFARAAETYIKALGFDPNTLKKVEPSA